MEESILTTIKKMLGLDPEYDAFDTDVIIGINSSLLSLNQLGIGTAKKFSITGKMETWTDFLGDDVDEYDAAKSYIYFGVKSAFDPSSSSVVSQAQNELMKQLEWRLLVQSEIDH